MMKGKNVSASWCVVLDIGARRPDEDETIVFVNTSLDATPFLRERGRHEGWIMRAEGHAAAPPITYGEGDTAHIHNPRASVSALVFLLYVTASRVDKFEEDFVCSLLSAPDVCPVVGES